MTWSITLLVTVAAEWSGSTFDFQVDHQRATRSLPQSSPLGPAASNSPFRYAHPAKPHGPKSGEQSKGESASSSRPVGHFPLSSSSSPPPLLPLQNERTKRGRASEVLLPHTVSSTSAPLPSFPRLRLRLRCRRRRRRSSRRETTSAPAPHRRAAPPAARGRGHTSRCGSGSRAPTPPAAARRRTTPTSTPRSPSAPPPPPRLPGAAPSAGSPTPSIGLRRGTVLLRMTTLLGASRGRMGQLQPLPELRRLPSKWVLRLIGFSSSFYNFCFFCGTMYAIAIGSSLGL